MKDTMKRVQLFNRIEFWVATIIFIMIVFSIMAETFDRSSTLPNQPPPPLTATEAYLFVSQLIWCITIYGAFLILTYVLVPKVIAGEQRYRNLALTAGVFLGAAIILGASNTWLRDLFNARNAYLSYPNNTFYGGFAFVLPLTFVYIIYALIRYAGIFFLTRFEKFRARFPFVTPGGIICFILWALILFLIFTDEEDRIVITSWSILIPFGIAFYWYNLYKVIPKKQQKKRPVLAFFLTVIWLMALSIFPVFTIALIFLHQSDEAISLSVFNALLQTFVTAPLSWIIYKRTREENEEIIDLKQQLGQSTASIDFLRSQINPHFLFNALNTLYGTAMLEKADRTAQGVQQLGDMMRFMFHENMQEKIALGREIDYLENYISLQCLRTDQVSGIQIQSRIQRFDEYKQIAPMLLIPFVENAFKHGVSLSRPSYINIILEKLENGLLFTVANSKHTKHHMDPEKDKSGIGLDNVRQRLQLLYPTTHTLAIQETDTEFLIKLVLQLS